MQTLVDAWLHFDPSNGDQVVVRARLPRTVAGLLVGGALGLAGAAMQAVARNPLADPGILGVNAGAALAVVVALAVFGLSGVSAYVWFALVGAALAAVVVYGVASLGREGATPVKLALAGAAMTAGLASLTNALLVTSRQALDSYRFWQVGSVGSARLGRDPGHRAVLRRRHRDHPGHRAAAERAGSGGRRRTRSRPAGRPRAGRDGDSAW